MESFDAIRSNTEQSPEKLAILMEAGVIAKYSPLLAQKSDQPLTPEEAKLKWIEKYGTPYRTFFNDHKKELMDLYEQNPEKAVDYIETELEHLPN